MISIIQEPLGETYKKLIEYAAKRSSKFALVHNLSFSEAEKKYFNILAQMEPYLIKKIKHNSWPGITNYGCCSVIYYFQCNRDTVSILQNTANSLYQWILPKLPMDLSFIDENNYEWFVSVSHERDSWLNICDEEKQKILDYVPNLQLGESESKTVEQLLQDKRATYLSLNHMNLHKLPEEIGDFKNLRTLSIEDDSIIEIPEFIGGLTNLEILSIAGRKISSIPSSIFNLSKLKELKIENTDVSVISKDIRKLKNLTVLVLSNNKITALPDEICELNYLWVMFVSFNKIEKLPKDIGKLTNLWYMGIHNNKIKKLPESIRDIPELKYISMFNNEFKDIECEIAKFKNMECTKVDAVFESF